VPGLQGRGRRNDNGIAFLGNAVIFTSDLGQWEENNYIAG
jgi:hypothetical protein